MKLYFSPGACSLSPHIVAAEAGLSIQTEKVDLKAHKTETGEDYYRINPKGYVPALRLDSGEFLTEGPAIVQYLADQSPASGLMPKEGSFQRYKVQEWLAKGYTIYAEPQVTPDGPVEGSKFMILKDPDGKNIEIVETGKHLVASNIHAGEGSASLDAPVFIGKH